MPQSVFYSDMPDRDNDGGSYIEEQRNPSDVDGDGGGSSMIPQACHRGSY